MRRICMIGMVAAGLVFTVARPTAAYCRVVTSARSFQHYFRDLEEAGDSLNPVERFVFSLALANRPPRT